MILGRETDIWRGLVADTATRDLVPDVPLSFNFHGLSHAPRTVATAGSAGGVGELGVRCLAVSGLATAEPSQRREIGQSLCVSIP